MKYNTLDAILSGFFSAVDNATSTHPIEEDVLFTFIRRLLETDFSNKSLANVLPSAFSENWQESLPRLADALAQAPNAPVVESVTDQVIAHFDTSFTDYDESIDALRSFIRALCHHKAMTPHLFKEALFTHLDCYEENADVPVFQTTAMAEFADTLKFEHL